MSRRALSSDVSAPMVTTSRVMTSRTIITITANHLYRPSGHDVHAAVDVDRAARDPTRVRCRKIRAGEADVGDVHQLAERRPLGRLVQEQLEILESRGGPGLERTGRNRVDPDASA